MKIGIFDPYLDDLGGGEKYMMSIALCLSKDHDVLIFWDNKKDLENIQSRFALNLSKCEITTNIFTSSTSFHKRLLESKKYDAIIFLSDGSIPFLLSKKLYIHIQQPLPHFQKSSLKSKLKLSRVTKFIFNSQFSKSFINHSLSEKSVVLYPPISLSTEKVDKENIILHVGRFRVRNVQQSNYKKQDFMINVFKEMVNNGLKGWKFFLAVGLSEKDKAEFEKMKESTSGYPIKFFLNLPNNKLWNLYNKSSIYWHASGFGEDLKKHPEYAEHFGISTVEAMGAGAVPVVINAGGQKEIVEDGENGLLWESKEELMAKTEKVINDQKLWQELSHNARRRAEQLSGDRFCEEVSKIVQ